MKSPTLPSRFSVAVGLGIALLAVTWLMLMGLLSLPNKPNSKAMPTPQTVPVQVVKAKHSPALVKAVSEPTRDINGMPLHTFEKEYTWVFKGKVTCAGGPCSNAEVKVQVSSNNNHEIVKIVGLEDDGSYAVTVSMREYPHEQVNWAIAAKTPDATIEPVQGRQILTDEPTVQIDEPLKLL